MTLISSSTLTIGSRFVQPRQQHCFVLTMSAQMPYLVDPNGFKKDLRKETDMVWSYVRTDEYSTVFKMRRDVDVDTYFIVINTDKSFKAAGPVSAAQWRCFLVLAIDCCCMPGRERDVSTVRSGSKAKAAEIR